MQVMRIPGTTLTLPTLLLAAAGALAGLAAVESAAILGKQGWALPATLAAAAGIALIVALLVALPLLLRLRSLDTALAGLAHGERHSAPSERTWPLGSFFASVASISARLDDVDARERQAAALREQALHQAREAAAREERNRLARELHDSIKQQIFGISVSAAAAQQRLEGDSSGSREALDDITRNAHEAQVEMRALLQQLRPAPLENIGLVEALRDQCEAFGYRTGAAITVEIGALPADDRLPPGAPEGIFRMAQEALANVAHHARAANVTLALNERAGALVLEVRDDGQGFDPARTHRGMGLDNIQQRALALGGASDITSAHGAGTIVRVRVPLVKPVRLSREEEERLAEVAAERKRGEQSFEYCLNAIQVAALLLFFGAPFWAVALGVVVAFSLYLRGRMARAQVALLVGSRGEPALALRHREREWLAVLLIVAALCFGYLPVAARPDWPASTVLAVTAAGVLLLLAAALAEWLLWRRDAGRYYALLAALRLRRELDRRRLQCIAAYWTWLVIVVLGIILGGWHPAVPPRTPAQWTDAATLAFLAVWMLFNILEHAQTLAWKRRLLAAKEAPLETREKSG